PLLPLRLLDVLLRIILKRVAEAGAAKVVGLALVCHLDRAQAAADDALGAARALGEGYALFGCAYLIDAGKRLLIRSLGLVAVQNAIGVQQYEDQALALFGFLVLAVQGERLILQRAAGEN